MSAFVNASSAFTLAADSKGQGRRGVGLDLRVPLAPIAKETFCSFVMSEKMLLIFPEFKSYVRVILFVLLLGDSFLHS